MLLSDAIIIREFHIHRLFLSLYLAGRHQHQVRSQVNVPCVIACVSPVIFPVRDRCMNHNKLHWIAYNYKIEHDMDRER